jgi:mitogen-activated protein kinase 15
LKKNFDAF